MKDNISRDKILMSGKIKEFVTFDTRRIAQKDTSFGSRIKFGSMVTKIGSKTQTAKGFKMRVLRNFMKKYLIRGLVG